MESTNLKVIITPPSLMKSLMAGFDAVSNHVSLILFSVLLDLLLWFGPHVRIAKLFEPIFQQAAAYPGDAKRRHAGADCAPARSG